MNFIIPKDTWLNPKVEIKDSSIGGKGMFAKEDVRKGEEVVIWGGEYVDKKGAENAKKNGKLVMQWDDNLFSVEEKGEDVGYFINHSCDPNLWMKDAFGLIARKNIRKGEEITADYALWEADENYISKWECNCGSSLCRKRITGKDWRMPELQKRYKDHFSPLINKRIERKVSLDSKWFTKWAKLYDYEKYILPPLRKKAARFLNLERGRKILDVATGTGAQAYELAKLGYDVVGVDLSPEMLKQARKKQKKELKLKFIQTDASHLPFENSTFDAVSISFGLHDMSYLVDLKVLKEIKRVVKPNGKILVVDYIEPKRSFMARLFNPVFRIYETRYWTDFLQRGLENLLRDVDLEKQRETNFLRLVQIVVIKNSKK